MAAAFANEADEKRTPTQWCQPAPDLINPRNPFRVEIKGNEAVVRRQWPDPEAWKANVFGGRSLLPNRKISWKLTFVSGPGCATAQMGVHSRPCACFDSIGFRHGLFWGGHPETGGMYCGGFDGRFMNCSGLPCLQAGDVCHFTFDPKALKLFLRMDRVPNKHVSLPIPEGFLVLHVALSVQDECVCRLEPAD